MFKKNGTEIKNNQDIGKFKEKKKKKKNYIEKKRDEWEFSIKRFSIFQFGNFEKFVNKTEQIHSQK